MILQLRTLLARIDYSEQMRRRSVAEAIIGAMPATWLRRAEAFEWARPRPGEYTGQATAEEIAARDRRCRAAAVACRRHAAALKAVVASD